MKSSPKGLPQWAAKLLSTLFSLAFGAGSALVALPYVMSLGKGSLLVFELRLFAVTILAIAVSYLLMIVLHEAGHLLAGLCSGYSFVSFRVGSLMLLRRDGRLQLKRYSLAGTAGQCLMKPPAWTEHGIPVRLYNLGGILVNAVCMLLCLIPALLIPSDTLPGMLLWMQVLVHALGLLTNGIPMRGNDGSNAIYLVHDLTAQRCFWQQLTANVALLEGVSIADMPDDWWTLPEDADVTNPLISSSMLMIAQRNLLRGHMQEADALIAHLLEAAGSTMLPLHRFLAENDRLWIELMTDDRPEAVAAFQTPTFRRMQKAMARYPDVIRTRYAEAVLHGTPAEAAAQRALLGKLSPRYPYPTELDAARRQMDAVDEKRG